jgi:hypothetical protein
LRTIRPLKVDNNLLLGARNVRSLFSLFLCVPVEGVLLFIMFLLKCEMTYCRNKNNNNNYRIAAAAAAPETTLTVAIIIAISGMMMVTAPSAATTITEAETTTPASSSGVELSPQPIYQERSPPGNITRINQTHAISTFSGNGTLTLPNTTQTINTTHNGTALISFTTSSGYAKETIRTENGETAAGTVYEIVQFNPAAPGEGKGIVIAVFYTNSTGRLAPLNGLILAGIDEFYANQTGLLTLWEWQNGIPLPPDTTMEESPSSPMNTTTS